MTILARSDHAGGVFCGSKDMGCCGQPHEYVIGPTGYPQITCHLGCEDFLRRDPSHSVLASKVPETYDEKTEREDWEKRGATDQQYIQAIATAKMAGVEVPESLMRVARGGRQIGGTPRQCADGHQMPDAAKFCNECGKGPMAEVVRCKDSHPNPVTAKFCAECAAPMGELVQGAVVPETPKAVTARPGRKPALKDLRVADLQAKCREMGLPAGGTKRDLLARIRAAR